MRCDLSRLLARKITKRIHSSKPASLNRPIINENGGSDAAVTDRLLLSLLTTAVMTDAIPRTTEGHKPFKQGVDEHVINVQY